ncbi:MAG: serine protease [Chloroflexi bacterium]|nr:serine protease [Chloroflexota bacterium]MCY3697818.1 serine protease [Chloroflexota bacterium]
MITSNVLYRTFHIRFGGGTGTAFVVDRERRQYLITARHVVEGIATGNLIDVFHEKEWKQVRVSVVSTGTEDTDIAVLSLPVRLTPAGLKLEASAGGLFYGQQVFFLGYPFGWDSVGESINRDFPLPFAKAGVVSALLFEDPSLIYIDAHGNPGFSGGPVVFSEPNRARSALKVAGIVARAPTPRLRPIVDRQGAPLTVNGNESAYFAENQGFVVAVSIRHAVEMIDANPIGFRLPPEEAE